MIDATTEPADLERPEPDPSYAAADVADRAPAATPGFDAPLGYDSAPGDDASSGGLPAAPRSPGAPAAAAGRADVVAEPRVVAVTADGPLVDPPVAGPARDPASDVLPGGDPPATRPAEMSPADAGPIGSAPAPPAQAVAEPLTDQGRALLHRDLALDAVEVLRQAVARGEPSAPDVLAAAYLDSGSFHAAVEWLGLLVDRGYVRFAGRLGIALAEIGDHDAAEDALRLAIGAGETAAANDLAILLRDMGRDAEAVQVLTRAAGAGDGLAVDNLVSFLLDADELAPAVEAAERYVDRARPDTVVALADARSAARRDEEAEELYLLADELGALRAHTAYATFLLATRADRVHAEQHLREARRHREPGSAAALGLFLVEDGRVGEGRDHLVVGATAGDRIAVAALAELDGEDPDDD